ncbi:MAG: hypothetical protein RQM90_12105 [Methanoculleus sp.]
MPELDIILLDNMTPDEVRETVRALSGRGLRDRVLLEVSGRVAGGDLSSTPRPVSISSAWGHSPTRSGTSM